MPPSFSNHMKSLRHLLGHGNKQNSMTECAICGSADGISKDTDYFQDPLMFCSLCRSLGFAAEYKRQVPNELDKRGITPVELAKAIHWMRDSIALQMLEAQPKQSATHANAITGHT